LGELAEADFELNFGAVFRLGVIDEDAEVRAAAINGLWEDEDVRLVPLLVKTLLEDEAPAVRAAAARSLGRFILLGELQKIRPEPHNQTAACQGQVRLANDRDLCDYFFGSMANAALINNTASCRPVYSCRHGTQHKKTGCRCRWGGHTAGIFSGISAWAWFYAWVAVYGDGSLLRAISFGIQGHRRRSVYTAKM